MAATFTFRLEYPDGSEADPPRFETTVLVWRAGDSIPLGRGRSLHVVDTRPGSEPDEAPVLVVEEDADAIFRADVVGAAALKKTVV